MLVESLRPSPLLEVFKYTDVDQFRHATRIVKADSIPLQTADFAAVTASIRLPGCRVHLQRTFPRIIDATLEGGALVIFPMQEILPVKVNGVDIDYPALVFARGGAGYRATEWQARTYALVVFDSPMVDRGWPELENTLGIFRLAPLVLAGLQSRIGAMFDFVSRFPDRAAPPFVLEDMKEQVLAGLDEAFAVCAPVGTVRTASSRHAEIVEALDTRIEQDPGVPLYSGLLAREFGVSVRTLHNVTVKFRGVSLHQYLRMKRLWMVRQQLLTGDPSLQVKSCALAFGFWHLGEFSSAYASLFGEVPSRTLARGRAR